MAPSLATTVAGIPFQTCVYNASGPRTGSSAALSKIAASASGGILAKSATLKSQTGNPQPRTWHDPYETTTTTTKTSIASLNSEGLPNSGIDYYLQSNVIHESINNTDKPYMISISGHTLEDNMTMLHRISNVFMKEEENENGGSKISAIELNLACPNVIGKPIVAYDFDQMELVLKTISSEFNVSEKKKNEENDTKKQLLLPPLGIKLPPYFDGPHFERAASILNRYSTLIKYVACINTIGNATAIETSAEMPSLSSNDGFAGLSGPAIRYTALANVRKMRQSLTPAIDVVGVGGITTGSDVFDMILCGANAVQVGTCHWKEGPKCFDRICDELRVIMEKKGYETIDQFRGHLRPWSKDGAELVRKEKKKKKEEEEENENEDLKSSLPSSNGRKDDGMDPFMMLSVILSIVVAILVADKYGAISI